MRNLKPLMRHLISTAAFAASFHGAIAAEKTVSLLAVPSQASETLASELKDIAHGPKTLASSPVFSASEAQALSQMGEPLLARSIRVDFANSSDARDFADWAKKNAPSVRIEGNPELTPREEPFEYEQWGLDNRGGTYPLDFGGFTTLDIPARAGEDIGITRIADRFRNPADPKKVVIAVLDTGIDLNHPDLKAAIETHPAECEALQRYNACLKTQKRDACDKQFAQLDTDGNGYPLDCNGWNFSVPRGAKTAPMTGGVFGDRDVSDKTEGHGTHVAGIIAAQLNQIGTVGAAPRARILPVKVIANAPNDTVRPQAMPDSGEALPAPGDTGQGLGLGDVVARGILYSIRSGANIISMSLGWPGSIESSLVRRMISLAQARGVLIVAAAGNDSTDSLVLPCRYSGVICVGAHGPDGALTYFSNYGSGVDVAAPGINILSTWPTILRGKRFTDAPGYDFKNGTSMATPFAAAVLARMLELGISPDEASARLVLGARPALSSPVETAGLLPNAILGGNIDLARSLDIEPAPLIAPASKDSVRIEWDRHSSKIPLTVRLNNRWIEARAVHVSIESLDTAARLARQEWDIASWPQQKEIAFSTDLQILDPKIDSELALKIRVRSGNGADREFVLKTEIVAIVDVATQDRDLEVSAIQGRVVPGYGSVRTVESASGEAIREYLGISASATERVLELLAPSADGKSIESKGVLRLATNGNTIRRFQKVDGGSGNRPFYALIEQLPPPPRMMTGANQITYLDEKLQPIASMPAQTIDVKITHLNENAFQWVKIGDRRFPAWVTPGRLPTLEAPAYDPWNPDRADEVEPRLYALTAEGLHTVALPEGYLEYLSLLQPTAAQIKEGVVPVLLAKGEDYELEYAIAELRGRELTKIQPLTLSQFRMLEGLPGQPALSLRKEGGFAGYAYSDVGSQGTQRSTVIPAGGIGKSLDFIVGPIRALDSAALVAGVYLGERRQSVFTLTKFQIQYHESSVPSVVATSLKRYSYQPDYMIEGMYLPIVVEDPTNPIESRIPALIVPADFAFIRANQVIVPRFDSAGKATSLIRPARFRIEAGAGCESLPTVRPAGAAGPAKLDLFCRDRIISVPLKY